MRRLRMRLVVLLAVLVPAAVVVGGLGSASAQLQIRCFGQEPTIVRGSGDDTVRGTRGNDVIYTGDGNDTVLGLGGRDRICSGLGRDTVNGGAGNDFIGGGPVLMMRWECIRGQWHQVTYDLSTNPATVVDDRNTEVPCDAPPPAPIDRPTALDGDRLAGGLGSDAIIAGDGNDGVLGGSGNDRVSGGLGDDGLGGGPGNDHLQGGPVFMTRWECRDDMWHLVTYDVSATPPREVDVINTEVPCPAEITPPITPTDRDGISGDAGNDLMRGGYGDDLLMGGRGRDRLIGDAGTDRLSGGRGNDACRSGETRRSC